MLIAAGLIKTLLEVALVRTPLVKPMVMVLAMLCERFVYVARPPDAVFESVPCNVPDPELRAAVTTVLLSDVRRFPN